MLLVQAGRHGHQIFISTVITYKDLKYRCFKVLKHTGLYRIFKVMYLQHTKYRFSGFEFKDGFRIFIVTNVTNHETKKGFVN